ncbi:MAG: DCC1-like thiol-disulfide oxidoreductase family protein [Saprospiraceae bacterium]
MYSSNSTQPIIYFDGTCVLCNWFFKWLVQHDKKKLFQFDTLQSIAGQELVDRLKMEVVEETVVLRHNKETYTYSTAVLKIFKMMGGWYKLMGILGLLFPKFLRDGVYLFISKNRYKWFGQQACYIPDKSTKERFVN